MTTLAPVFHHARKPISVQEFRDAVLATCKPQFPSARYARPRRIALAISGGVDSMAMACLFADLLSTYRSIKIADNPVHSVFAVIVDHKLRESSTAEASLVCQSLQKLGVRPFKKTLNWKELRWQGVEPQALPNIETIARTMRYRAIGNACRYLSSSSLFFAHHRDDQYETVLMRLLAGHGYRGLQGMREANTIPECYDMHGVYKSGFLDDQAHEFPFLSFKPAGREIRQVRQALKRDLSNEPWEQIQAYLGLHQPPPQLPGLVTRGADPRAPFLAPLNSEEGGVTVYRPLLEFDKERLIATCEAHGVPWFEDHTNNDPTMTPRNALRHLVKSHNLPIPLQKDSILQLARRCRTRARREDAEAHRLLVRERVIEDFDPNTGTLLVRLPTFKRRAPYRRRLFQEAREAASRPHRRLIATIATRKLIDFVTPDQHLTPLANLDNVVDQLFPELSPNYREGQARVTQRKPFPIAGVIFQPLSTSDGPKWFISRAPYTSNQSLPERKLPGYLSYRPGLATTDPDAIEESYAGRLLGSTYAKKWRTWKTAKIWDGRFWIRMRARVPARFHILPFQPEHAKPFRMALAPADRSRLERVLKHYAPGKVRYSLPGLYSVQQTGDAASGACIKTLLALPSLGIHVPGLLRWVRYEARYKNVDASLLQPTADVAPATSLRKREAQATHAEVKKRGGSWDMIWGKRSLAPIKERKKRGRGRGRALEYASR